MSTKNTKNQVTNNSIIDVVVNGMTASETVKEVQIRLESVEKSIFNVALLCSYGTGITIPAYTDNKGEIHGEATIEKPFKQVDFVKLVGRSNRAISRWTIAMKLVIDNGYFTDFASGKYPFSYDKIITIFKENNKSVFSGMLLSDLMSLSASALDTMVDDYKPADDKKEETNKEETDTNTPADTKKEKEETSSEIEVATLSYNGKDYNVPKIAFERWLGENMIVEK